MGDVVSELSNRQRNADRNLRSSDRNARDQSRQIRQSTEQGAFGINGHEKVGYRSPPKEHQIKKGQSGKPRGRPRKSVNRKTKRIRTLNDAALAEAERLIVVQDEEVAVGMSVQQAVMRSIAERAIKGDGVH